MQHKFKLTAVSLIVLLTSGTLYAAEPAGRVLIIQGEATAQRGGKVITLARGVVLESGDLVSVGDRSSLQIRFTDESMMALRANTQFKIDEYKLGANSAEDKSVFSLLKGGLRTVTGLIGKRSKDKYELKNETATIGIRGTHYTAVSCTAGSCQNADGSAAPDGLYGSVTDGTIVVRNQAGESEFNRDQYFMVAGPAVMPRGLVAPPSFLRDKLDGTARGKGGQQKAPTEQLAADQSAGSSSQAEAGTDSTASTPGDLSTPTQNLTSSVETSTSPSPTSALNVASNSVSPVISSYTPSDAPAVSDNPEVVVDGGSTGGGPVGGSTNAFVEASAYAYNYLNEGPGYIYTGHSAYSWAEQYEWTDQYSGDYDNFLSKVNYKKDAGAWEGSGSYETTDNLGNPITVNYTYEYSKSASEDLGSTTAIGRAYWGRYHEVGSEVRDDGSSYSSDGYFHWVIADPVVSMPTAGVTTYTPIGGTSPTDQYGNVGTMISRGEWRLDFGGKTIQTSKPIQWTMPGGYGYSVSVPSQSFMFSNYSYVEEGYSSKWSYISGADGYDLETTTSCTHPCTNVYSSADLYPSGGNAEGLVVGLATEDVGHGKSMASVHVYQGSGTATSGGTGSSGSGSPYLSFVKLESSVEMSPTLESFAEAIEFSFADQNSISGFDYLVHAQDTGQSVAELFMNAQTVDTGDEIVEKSAALNTGYNSAGNVYWGRFAETGTEVATGNTWSGHYHVAIGDPVTSMPTSGLFTYNPVGGTNPTNQNGVEGTMTSRGQWTVDFGGKTIATAQPITWNMPDGANFSVSMPQQNFQIVSTSPGTGVTMKVVDTSYVNTSCSGCTGAVASEIGVAFMGANAEAMGAAISTTHGSDAISSVQVYKR